MLVIHARFQDRTATDVFARLFAAVSGEPDMQYATVDATIVQVRRHGRSAEGERASSQTTLGSSPRVRSEGGVTTKACPRGGDVLALTDALGNLVRFVLLPGQRHDAVGIAQLLEGVSFGAPIADKAFDGDAILADLAARGATAVISRHPRRAKPPIIDAGMVKWRHLIENFFRKLKDFQRIAMRADRQSEASPR